MTLNFKKSAITVLGLFMLIAGVYLLLLIQSPKFIKSTSVEIPETVTPKEIEEEAPVLYTGNQVVIPKIGVNLEYKTGGKEVMQDAVWWRHPDRGSPTEGNFILSAHRFRIGWTPVQTRNNSPFYNIDKLNEGDQILIYKDGVQYEYSVTKKYRVEPTATYIEAPSTEHKLTIYSCTLAGSRDGREVIEAELI